MHESDAAQVVGYGIGAAIMGVVVIVASLASGAPAGILAGVALIVLGVAGSMLAKRVAP